MSWLDDLIDRFSGEEGRSVEDALQEENAEIDAAEEGIEEGQGTGEQDSSDEE